MRVNQDIRKEREKMKNAPFGKKLEYFWDYYKWHVIAAVAVLAVIASFVIPAVTAKETVLSGVLLNCYQASMDNRQEALSEELLSALDEDPEKCTVELNTGLVFDPENEEATQLNYQSVQAIGAQITVGQLDFMVGNLEAMLAFCESGTFYALSEVLNPEELERYESLLISPEGAGPVLIDISGSEVMAANYPYLSEPLVLGIAVNAPHPEQVPALLDYLLHSAAPIQTK